MRLLLLLTLLLALEAARAQEAPLLTPDAAVALGLAHDARLTAARAEAAAAEAAYRQARAARLPSVGTQASYTRLSDNIPAVAFSTDFLPGLDTTFTLAPVALNRYYAEVSLEQPLFTGFRLQRQARAARFEAEAARRSAAQAEADVALAVRQAYWRLYEALALQAVAEQALVQVEAFLQEVERRQAAGAALPSDVLAARTRRAEVRLARLEADNAAQAARLTLNRLTGRPLGAAVQPVAEAAAPPREAAPDSLVARALAARPALEALAAQVEALRAQTAATRGAWLPEVALTGRYVYARPNQYFFAEQDQFRGTWEAGALLRWRLWDGGARAAEAQRAEALLAAAEARLAYARQEVAVGVLQQHLDVERAREAVAVAGENVQAAAEAFRVARLLYREGAALTAQVLDAEQALRSAEGRQARARAALALAHAGLINALGQAW